MLKRFPQNTYLVTIAEKRGRGRNFDNDIVNVCRMKRYISREGPPVVSEGSAEGAAEGAIESPKT